LLTGGEPLVRSDFLRIAAHAKERGFILMILTNGTLVTRDIAREIARLRPLFVCLSLYGATDSVHDGVTGMPGSFEATMRGIELLRESETPVALQATLMDSNIHQARAMKALAGRLKVPLRLSYELAPTKSCALSPQCHEASLADMGACMEADLLEAPLPEPNGTEVCKAGRGACSISPAGDVFPCIMMPLKLGNVRSAKFCDIWENECLRELTYLRGITGDDLQVCSKCDISAHCAKCIGRNLSETGALTRPAPSACRNATLRSRLLPPA
jgi:radical SAM protein with 4Fe4S-binding SPASM domain